MSQTYLNHAKSHEISACLSLQGAGSATSHLSQLPSLSAIFKHHRFFGKEGHLNMDDMDPRFVDDSTTFSQHFPTNFQASSSQAFLQGQSPPQWCHLLLALWLCDVGQGLTKIPTLPVGSTEADVVTDGWSKWCWKLDDVFVDDILYNIYIYIYISIYLIFIQVYTCVDGICWVLMCSICWYLRDDLMNWRSQRLSKWRDDQLLPHERHLFNPIALCLFDIANLKITMFKSKLSEIINKYRIFHSY